MTTPTTTTRRIFVSSTRTDLSDLHHQVHEGLARNLGRQAQFPPAAIHPPHKCDAMLVLIGPGWAAAVDENDRIKADVAAARRARRPVLPVFLDADASTPNQPNQPNQAKPPPDVAAFATHPFWRIRESHAEHDLEAMLKALARRLPGLTVTPDSLDAISPPPQPHLSQKATATRGVAQTIAGDVHGRVKNVGGDDKSKRLLKIGGSGAGVGIIVLIVLYGWFKGFPTASSSDDSNIPTNLVLPTSQVFSQPSDSAQPVSVPPSISSSSTTQATTTATASKTTTTVSRPPAAAYAAGAGGITGNSLCRDFLVAPQNVQYQAAERIVIAMNFTQEAGDPFIIQNAEYMCGQNLDVKLADLYWYEMQHGQG